MEIVDELKAELERMKPDYQKKVAYLLTESETIESYGAVKTELAVIEKETGVVLSRESDLDK